jgi:hypothetical protein
MEVVLNQSQLEFIRGGDLKLQLEFYKRRRPEAPVRFSARLKNKKKVKS